MLRQTSISDQLLIPTTQQVSTCSQVGPLVSGDLNNTLTIVSTYDAPALSDEGWLVNKGFLIVKE